MAKTTHEVRDGIHGFVLFNNRERALIDSRPFQRLRNIHQLAMTYHVYPGATHKRFEHSIGVMEIASRIFGKIIAERIPDAIHERVENEIQDKSYWRSVVRAAALLHDIGHLPFSHAAEAELLPEGWDHERLTADIIRNSEISQILPSGGNPITVEDVIDVAYSVKDRAKRDPNFALTPWKTLLNEIITGNTFGADRIDYLLRDSWHAGVAYGRFDPDRLISGLKLIIDPETDDVAIGLDVGAIHSAEALLLARYFMYTQVYFHDVRRAYDIHLKDYLVEWLPEKRFPTNWENLLAISDVEVLTSLNESMSDTESPLFPLAQRVIGRQHFRTIFDLVSSQKLARPTILEDVYQFAKTTWGSDNVRISKYGPKSESNSFPVQNDDGSIENSRSASRVIENLPSIEIGQIYLAPEIAGDARQRIGNHIKALQKGKVQ